MNHPLLGHYEAIARASARMLVAARAGDWDNLAASENECAHLIETLQTIEPDPALRLEPAHHRQRIRVLREILGNDAEIRRLTQHWLHGLEALLRTTGLTRLVTGMQANRAPSSG